MDSFLTEQSARIAEENVLRLRALHRKEKDALIEKYNGVIKGTIVNIYTTHKSDIDRMIDICKEMKTCHDTEQCEKLQTEVATFKKLLVSMCDELKLYEKCHWNKKTVFPNWDPEIVREWLIYWDVPIGHGWLMESYHQRKRDGTLEIAFDNDYKAENVWIDIPAMIMNYYMWRRRFGLEHLQAICLYAK